MPTRAVEGEHELSAEPLVERMKAHERLELADSVGLAPQGEHRLEASFERLQAEAFEARDLRLREGLVRKVGQRRATPERERLGEERLGLVGCARTERGSPFGEQPLELLGVERPSRYAQHIPGRLGHELGLPVRVGVVEQPAQLRHVHLDAVRRRCRRGVAPERIDEAITRDDAVAFEEKQCEQASLLGAAEREHAATDDHLHRPEDTELDHRSPPSTTAQP